MLTRLGDPMLVSASLCAVKETIALFSSPQTIALCAAQVLANSRAMANKLTSLGYKLVSGGTDNHLVLGRTPLHAAHSHSHPLARKKLALACT
jgi:glycine/serine hydroxymethyltransferase